MYDTLLMLKPGESFTVGALQQVVADVTRSGLAKVARDNGLVRVTTTRGWLEIGWCDAAHVVEESNEIAEEFGVPPAGCLGRFEMAGDDPDMELFNDYLLINERLQATGKFVIFDTHECKLLFE